MSDAVGPFGLEKHKRNRKETERVMMGRMTFIGGYRGQSVNISGHLWYIFSKISNKQAPKMKRKSKAQMK